MKSTLTAALSAVVMVVAVKFLPLKLFLLLVALIFVGGALLRPLGFYRWLALRQEGRLAAKRPGMNDIHFVDALVEAGADRDVARWMLEEFRDYYGDRTTPHVADFLGADIGLDDEDMEAAVAGFFEDMNLPMPSTSAPEILPSLSETTLMSLALFLTHRRVKLRGGESIDA